MEEKEPRQALSPLFTWRSAICKSDLPAPSRHVALVLSLHMSELGDSCYPSQARLVRETGLSRRTVQRHLDKLEEEGWIEHHGWKTWESPGGEQKTKRWRAVLPRGRQSDTPLGEGGVRESEGGVTESSRGRQSDAQGRYEDDRGRRRAHAREERRNSGPGDVTYAGVNCPDCGEELRVRSGGLYCTTCAGWKHPET